MFKGKGISSPAGIKGGGNNWLRISPDLGYNTF